MTTLPLAPADPSPPPPVSEDLRRCATEIRMLARETAEIMVKIGSKFAWAWDQLDSGSWEMWVKLYVGMPVSAARDYLRIYHMFKDFDFTGIAAEPAALRVLARVHLLPESHDYAKGVMEAHGKLTVDDAKQIVWSDPAYQQTRERRDQKRREATPEYQADLQRRLDREIAKQHDIIREERAPIQIDALPNAIRALQQALSEIYGVPLHPRVASAVDRLWAIAHNGDVS